MPLMMCRIRGIIKERRRLRISAIDKPKELMAFKKRNNLRFPQKKISNGKFNVNKMRGRGEEIGRRWGGRESSSSHLFCFCLEEEKRTGVLQVHDTMLKHKCLHSVYIYT